MRVIVNSVKSLTILTPNINNLPFQVCWDKNRLFKYENINKKIKLFISYINLNHLGNFYVKYKDNKFINIHLEYKNYIFVYDLF